MNLSNPTPRQMPLRDGEREWLNRPGRFRVGGVTRDAGRNSAAKRSNGKSPSQGKC